MTREELRQLVVSEGLGRVSEQIVNAAKCCVRMQSYFFNGEELLGVSKIGGNPSLPNDVEWPYWKNKPLVFLAQICLCDIEAFEFENLPQKGYLWFFYDLEQSPWGLEPDDKGSWRVIYSEVEQSDLLFRPFPEPENFSRYAPMQLRYSPGISIPPWESLFVNSLDLSDSEKDLYVDMVEYIESLGPEGPKHQLLGYPFQIQGEMQTDCQLVSLGTNYRYPIGYQEDIRPLLQEGIQDWQLLFQIDTDDDAGMMWGDCGTLYFWIHEQDLKNRAFDQTWMILQCS